MLPSPLRPPEGDTLRAPQRRFTIGEAGRQCGLTARAIRLYEDRGLVSPERDAQGGRYYTDHEMDELHYIASARRAGLGIGEIAGLLDVGRLHGRAAQRARLVEVCRARSAILDAQKRALERLAQQTPWPTRRG